MLYLNLPIRALQASRYVYRDKPGQDLKISFLMSALADSSILFSAFSGFVEYDLFRPISSFVSIIIIQIKHQLGLLSYMNNSSFMQG